MNGAGFPEILVLLNMDFVKWVIVAFVFAVPVSWLVMHKWLEGFAYKTDMSWWIFALSGFLILVTALITVTSICWRSITRNPVEALRYE